jgi:SnoaL-like domain/Rho termination factor, N-terminal domain
MNKSELESKHIAELHELAAEAGVERYRMLTRAELIEKLAGGNGKPQSKPKGERRGGGGGGGGGESGRRRKRERKPREQREPKREAEKEPEPQAAEPRPAEPKPAQPKPEGERPRRKRRRRRWGRRRKQGGIREHADRWVEAWNARDLDEIAACYSENVEFVLPALVGDSEERRIGGREALREHFRHGLELAPNLTVSEESLLVGPSGFAILYRREDGHRAIEAVELDGDGLAARVRVFYEREQPDG